MWRKYSEIDHPTSSGTFKGSDNLSVPEASTYTNGLQIGMSNMTWNIYWWILDLQ
jgi:hypothetical protein